MGSPGMEDVEEFRVGKFVWAKIVGLPWWPAKVVLPQVAPEYVLKFRQEDRILVYFFGTKDYAWLPRDALRPFQDSKEKFAVERPMKTHKKVHESTIRSVRKGRGRCATVWNTSWMCSKGRVHDTLHLHQMESLTSVVCVNSRGVESL